jgi:N-acetylglucosaminyldiphosphoundecaprenol N-acetyl-beta-D-mannosaminyltransferase
VAVVDDIDVERMTVLPTGPEVLPGVRPFVGDLPAATTTVVEHALSGKGGHVCLLNVHLLVMAKHDQRVVDALGKAALVLADGSPVAWLQRRLGAASARRVPGPDLMPLVMDAGRAHGLRHFLYGSTDDVLESLRARLETEFPGVEIVGTHSPPFGPRTPDEELADVKMIGAAAPHVVWCALGAPKQELWSVRNAPGLAPAVVVGIGAAFEFIAGTKARAPESWQRLGIEWLHRLVTEPRRLAWRYVRTNPEFALVALRQWLRRGKVAVHEAEARPAELERSE